MKRLFIALVVLLVCIVTILGCAKPAPITPSAPASTPAPTAKPTSTAPAAEQPQYGGVLKMITYKALSSLEAPGEKLVAPGVTGPDSANIIWDNILRFDVNGNWAPGLATNFQVSPDGKTVTLTLRKGIKFHDGTDCNAAAIASHLESQKPTVELFRTITSMDVIDDYTLRLQFPKFDAKLANKMLVNGKANSPTALAKPTTTENRQKDHISGAGPFKYVEWKRDVTLKTVKFADYWDKGKPYLDGVEVLFFADATSALMAFETGVGQVIRNISPREATDLRAKGYSIGFAPAFTYTLQPDGANADSPFAKKGVREAVEYALDKKALADSFGVGFSTTMDQVFPAALPNGYNPAIKGRPYDPAKAKQLLAEAGYANGFKTSIYALMTDDRNLLVAVQTYLKAIGIDAELALKGAPDFATLGNDGWKNGLRMRTYGLMPVAIEPLDGVWFKPNVARGESQSIYRAPGFLDTVAQAAAELNDAKRKALIDKAVQMAADEAMLIPFISWPQINAWTKSVHGMDDLLYPSFHVQQYNNIWLSK